MAALGRFREGLTVHWYHWKALVYGLASRVTGPLWNHGRFGQVQGGLDGSLVPLESVGVWLGFAAGPLWELDMV